MRSFEAVGARAEGGLRAGVSSVLVGEISIISINLSTKFAVGTVGNHPHI